MHWNVYDYNKTEMHCSPWLAAWKLCIRPTGRYVIHDDKRIVGAEAREKQDRDSGNICFVDRGRRSH